MVIIAILALSVTSVVSASEDSHKPKLKVKHDTSTNWAGYAVDSTVGSVTDVKGSWIVPAVSTLTPKKDDYSSFWVGIDGDTSNTVEQIGTDCDVIDGIPKYSTWYEFYPQNPVKINSMKIKPGDKISAEVNYNPSLNKYTVYITDTDPSGNVQSFSTSPSNVKPAKRNSAEWITEATSKRLANFNQVYFSSNYATISGTENSLGLFTTANPITMVGNSGLPRATPSELSTDGNFSVTWNSAGP